MDLTITFSKEQMAKLGDLAEAFDTSSKEEAIVCMLEWYLKLREVNKRKVELQTEIKELAAQGKQVEEFILQNSDLFFK